MIVPGGNLLEKRQLLRDGSELDGYLDLCPCVCMCVCRFVCVGGVFLYMCMCACVCAWVCVQCTIFMSIALFLHDKSSQSLAAYNNKRLSHTVSVDWGSERGLAGISGSGSLKKL